MERRFILVLAAAMVLIPSLLLLERDGFGNQLALGLATTGLLIVAVRSSRIAGSQILCCVIVATIGEVVLSVGWGLYHYKHALIPLYVPPGHGLFYALAATTAQQDWFRRRQRAVIRGALVFGCLTAVSGVLFLNDTWGFIWWLGAVTLILCSTNRLMLSTCFFYTILLEWLGTTLGNWQWAATVPGLRLHSANPPSGVGILYILLDLIVVGISSAVFNAPREIQAGDEPVAA
jgi:hypothetical protein